MIDPKLIALALASERLIVGCGTSGTDSTADEMESSAETSEVCDGVHNGDGECICLAPEDVCVVPDPRADELEQTCAATVDCRELCDPPFCPGEGNPNVICQADHASYFETASPECIELLATAEQCYIGMTCAELIVAWASPCDPQADPCTPHWVAYSTAGCNYIFYPFSPYCL